jgi:hypothetical protein
MVRWLLFAAAAGISACAGPVWEETEAPEPLGPPSVARDAGVPVAPSPIGPKPGSSPAAPPDAGLSPAPADAGAPPAGPACTHPPVSYPDADPTGLAPGPVVSFRIAPYYVKKPPTYGVIEDPVIAEGKWIVRVNDRIVLDSFQKNADRRECQWVDYPVWSFYDATCAFERRSTGNPFLAQLQVLHAGEMTVSASCDGVGSNSLTIVAIP